VQGEIPDTLIIRLGATPSGLISDPPPLSPIFTPDALRAATLTLHPGLGQTLNMLACIPSGLVQIFSRHAAIFTNSKTSIAMRSSAAKN